MRLLVGAGLRASEPCGLAVVGPDGLPDVMSDSLTLGRVQLRVRWDAGAKGQKARRVPITPKLAAIVKRYEARHRPEVVHANLVINRYGRPYQRFGIDKMMDRLSGDRGLPGARPRVSGTPSPRWQRNWAGTWSTCGRRWATLTTRCFRTM